MYQPPVTSAEMYRYQSTAVAGLAAPCMHGQLSMEGQEWLTRVTAALAMERLSS